MKIGTLSSKTGFGIHTIRYYEKQGLIKNPEKDESGHRSYDLMDVDVLNWVSCMKNSGMSLSEIKKYTKAFYENEHMLCVAFLEEHLGKLQIQKNNIDHYIEVTKNKIYRFKNA